MLALCMMRNKLVFTKCHKNFQISVVEGWIFSRKNYQMNLRLPWWIDYSPCMTNQGIMFNQLLPLFKTCVYKNNDINFHVHSTLEPEVLSPPQSEFTTQFLVLSTFSQVAFLQRHLCVAHVLKTGMCAI